MTKMGKRVVGRQRAVIFAIRLTEAERAAIEKLAVLMGMSASAAARLVLLNRAESKGIRWENNLPLAQSAKPPPPASRFHVKRAPAMGAG